MNDKIKQFVAFGVCSVVALALCLVVLVITVNNIDNKAVLTDDKTIINKTALKSSEETLVEYINELVLKTDDRFVKTKTYTDVFIDDLNVLSTSGNKQADESLLNFASDKMLSVVDGYYDEDAKGTFKNDNSKKLALSIDKKMLKNADFSIGQVDENGDSVFDDEGNLVDEEFYYLTYNLDIENKTFYKKIYEMISAENDLYAKERFIDEIKDDCRIDSFKSKPQKFSVKAKVNREKDEIEYIKVIKNYIITFDAAFINNLEFFGGKEISFIYTVIDTYEYSYAGVSFVDNEISVGVNNEYMLNINAVIDDDSEYNVEFLSSDENIASVDEMGYVKVLKNCNVPVTITVKLSYLGEIFTDTCVVNVSAAQGGVFNE